MISKAYPKVAKNSTLNSGAAQKESRGLVAKQGTTNVNVAQGPRTGVQGRAGKRADLMARRAEGGALADTINRAYAARVSPPKVNPALEGVAADVKPRSQKR
mgnify:CR=1 FL=1